MAIFSDDAGYAYQVEHCPAPCHATGREVRVTLGEEIRLSPAVSLEVTLQYRPVT